MRKEEDAIFSSPETTVSKSRPKCGRLWAHTDNSMSIKRCCRCVCIPPILEQWRYDICPVFDLDGLFSRWLVVTRRCRLENQAIHSGEDENASDHARHLASQPVEGAIGEFFVGAASWRISMTSVFESDGVGCEPAKRNPPHVGQLQIFLTK